MFSCHFQSVPILLPICTTDSYDVVFIFQGGNATQPYTRMRNSAIFIACLKGRGHQSSLEHEVLLKIMVNVEHLLREENAYQNCAMRVLCVRRP